jgi:hypothetical protein
MAKKDGLEIFELFRTGNSKGSVVDAPAETPREKTSTIVRATPKPAPLKTDPAPAPAKPDPAGETVVSMKLNTALFSLMVGAACLFGAFALGVRYERGRHPVIETSRPDPAPVVADLTAKRDPPVVREAPPVRREAPPVTRVEPPAPEGPKKGWSIQLMAYPADQEYQANRMCEKVRAKDGVETSVVRIGPNFVVLAGFLEKQTGADAEALMRKYRDLANRMGSNFNLDWIQHTK